MNNDFSFLYTERLFPSYKKRTVAPRLIEECQYPWQILTHLSDYILRLGPTLKSQGFEQIGEQVWVSKSAKLSKSAEIEGAAIICESAEIRHSAYIRGNVIVGRECVVGNSTELKNSLLFDRVQVPHFNYIGDSIMGFLSHTGAGVILSNVKGDRRDVEISTPLGRVKTNMRKLGAILGERAEIGCNAVLNPGSVVGVGSRVYPLSSVKGYIPEGSIYKSGVTVKIV